MTCYQRHLTWLFEALDLPYEKKERKSVDSALRAILGLGAEVHCPELWAAYKALPEERQGAALAEEVRQWLAGAGASS
jgi:hypothetical protein